MEMTTMTDFSDMAGNGHIYIKAYSADGFQIGLTLPALTVADAMRHLEDVRAAGLLTMMPEATAGELIETMTMCVRRETVNKHDDTVPVIDCYFNGGKFKWVTLYLDDDTQRAEFERQSGLTVAKMPLYASQAPLQAGERATMKYEVQCPRPFVAVKVPAREKEVNGVKQMTYKFARYGGQPASAMPQPEQKAPIIPIDEHNFGHRAPDTRKPKAAAAPKETLKGVRLDAAVWVKVGKDGNPFYVFYDPKGDQDVYAFTRAPFRSQGWDADAWEYVASADKGLGAQINLDRHPMVDMERAADGYWHVTRATAYQLCDEYVEGATA
jgi:hypothetical protein